MATRKFLVEISEADIYKADAAHINRQTFAKHVREELIASGGVYGLGEWERKIFNNVKVTCVNKKAKGD